MDPLRQELSSITPSASPSPPSIPTNDDIEAVIQLATSSCPPAEVWQPTGKDTRTQLFVGNLPYRIRWQDLKDLFRKAGTVLRADVSLGPDNRSRGYGTVMLATAEDAGRAIDMFHGFTWQTRVLEVRHDRIPTETVITSLPGMAGSFVVPTSAAASGLVTTVYGTNPIMASGPIASLPASTNAHSDFDFTSLLGLERPTSTNNGSRNLFVGNLPFHCQWQDLKDLFRQAGAVSRADVALGVDGRSRGFGTVLLVSEADAERAVKMFNGYEYSGRILKVHYDKFPQSGLPNSSSTSTYSPPFNDTVALFQSDPSSGLTLSPPFMGHHPSNHPMHIPIPVSYPFDLGPGSGPTSPYEVYPPLLQPSVPDPHNLSHLSDGSTTSSSIPTSASSSGETDGSTPQTPPSSYSGSNRPNPHHHAHPGHIALPPPPLVTSFSSVSHPHSPAMMSPSHLHRLVSQDSHHTTPHGLPPITPSMPPFNFLPPFTPPAYAHPYGVGTPSSPPAMHPHSHILSPFSPGVTMSPGAFWGRPGGQNPFINPAVGAPVHDNSGNDVDANSTSQDCSESLLVTSQTKSSGYFPPMPLYMPNEDTGYFPPMPQNVDPLPKENVLAEVNDGGQREHKDEAELASPSETDVEAVEGGSSSSSTSWHTSDEIDNLASNLEDKGKISDGSDERLQEKEKQAFRDDVGVIRSESRAPLRTLSLSPLLKKPVLPHPTRADSDS